MIKKYLLSLIILFIMFSAHAEESKYSPKDTWWINGGLGFGLLVSHVETDILANNDQPVGFAELSFNYALFDTQFIELRATGSGAMLSFVNDIFCLTECGPYVNSVNDVGLMYGLMKKEKWYLVGGSVGLAYTDVQYRKTVVTYDSASNSLIHEHIRYNDAVIGVPFEAQLFYTPFKYVGIGLVGMGNLNSEGSVVGLLLALQVGKLRS